MVSRRPAPLRALIVVDFQNDFTPGGALGVPGGDSIAPRINALAASGDFELVVATRDWHPADHGSFRQQGGPWPPHCVRGTSGAELHPALDRSRIETVLDKGQDPLADGYSGFENPALTALLSERRIGEVVVVGLATDYCVKHTALDALRTGVRVRIDPDAVRGVNVEAGDDERALDELRAAGAEVIPGP